MDTLHLSPRSLTVLCYLRIAYCFVILAYFAPSAMAAEVISIAYCPESGEFDWGQNKLSDMARDDAIEGCEKRRGEPGACCALYGELEPGDYCVALAASTSNVSVAAASSGKDRGKAQRWAMRMCNSRSNGNDCIVVDSRCLE